MRIVITGSEGYIGLLIQRELRNKLPDAEIMCIDFSTVGTSKDVLRYDIRDIVLGKKYDVLIHLAAYTSVTESVTSPGKYFDNNCTSYEEFLNSNKFDHVIYASSYSVYGNNSRVEQPLSPYADTKLIGEFMSKRNSDTCTIFRFANPIGIDKDLHQPLVKKILQGEPNVMWKLAEAKYESKVFKIHDNPNMLRDFYPVAWIGEACVKAVIDKPDRIIHLGSHKETPIVSVLSKICLANEIKFERVKPPSGTPDGCIIADRWLENSGISNQHYDPVNYCLKSFDSYYNLIKDSK